MLRVERKVLALGANCVAVTIPALWRDANHLEAGDIITMELGEGCLTLQKKHGQFASDDEPAKKP